MSLDNINNARTNFLDGNLEIKDDSVYSVNTKTYTVKGYEPDKFYNKFSKSCLLTSCNVIILIIIIIVTVVNYSRFQALNASQHKAIFNETNAKYSSQHIIINDINKLWTYDLKDGSLDLLHQIDGVIDSFDMNRNGKIFLSTFMNTSTIISRPYENLITKNIDVDTIFQEARIRPRAIAFDYIGDILYIIDESKGCLMVVDVHTRQYNILLSDLLQPINILLDPPEGIMFILQMSHSIIKGNMNGENLDGIIQGSGISALTIDDTLKRLYWVDDFIGIKSSNYNGENQSRIVAITSTILDLLILDNQLFWLWQDHHDSSSYQLLSCKIDANSCSNRSMNTLDNLRNPTSIRKFSDKKKLENQSFPNPCKINKGNCQHLCLVSSRGTHSCGCKLGWQLNPDERTCRESRNFILYVSGNLIRGHILDGAKKTFGDVILPTTYYTNSSKLNITFDYDQRNDIFYFAEELYVWKMKLKEYKAQKLLFDLANPSYPPMVIINLAFDWLTEKLYYFRYEKYPSSGYIRYYIKKYKFEGFDNVQYFDSQNIIKSGIIIHPHQNYIFYVGKNNSLSVNSKHIQRTSINTTSVPVLLNTTSVNIDLRKPLAIDYQENRLYWIEKNNPPIVIKQSNFDGFDVHEITIEGIPPVERIFVYRQWIYLVDNTTVWRTYKKTGKGGIKVMSIPENSINRPMIDDIKLISDAT